MAEAEKQSSHQADDGQIDLEFTEEAQEVTLEDVSEESSAPEPVEEEQKSSDDEYKQYSESVQKRINQLTKRAREAERQREEAVNFAQQVQRENQSVKERQWVIFARYAGSRFRLNDEKRAAFGSEVRILNDDEILGTILDPDDIYNG